MELNLEKFNPKKAELTNIAINNAKLVITDIRDKEGYKAVDTARKISKKIKIEIKKTGKAMRDEANLFCKKVIKAEKELTEIVEKDEKQLQEKIKVIDELIEIEKRKELLPDRKNNLENIEINISEDEILKMDSDEFQEFYNDKKSLYLEVKERKLKEQQDKIDREKAEKEKSERLEKEAKEAEEKRKKDLEIARKQATKLAKQKADEKAKKEKERVEREHQAELDRVNQEKQDLLDKQKREKEEKERVEKAEKEKSERLEKEKKYIEYTVSIDYDFYKKEEGKIVFYKKVGEFII